MNYFRTFKNGLMNSFYLLFAGYYQPAGPLINPHLVGGPQNLTKQPTSSPLDPESLQQSQQTSSVGEGNKDKKIGTSFFHSKHLFIYLFILAFMKFTLHQEIKLEYNSETLLNFFTKSFFRDGFSSTPKIQT